MFRNNVSVLALESSGVPRVLVRYMIRLFGITFTGLKVKYDLDLGRLRCVFSLTDEILVLE